MATHSSILAWKIPWTEEPDRLQSMGCKESDTTERLTKWGDETCLAFRTEQTLGFVEKTGLYSGCEERRGCWGWGVQRRACPLCAEGASRFSLCSRVWGQAEGRSADQRALFPCPVWGQQLPEPGPLRLGDHGGGRLRRGVDLPHV